MNKYIVRYRAYDNDAWKSRDGEMVIEANSEAEAKEIVHDHSDYAEEYFATSVMLID